MPLVYSPKLDDILKEIKKENSGIILGNGFCTWLYRGRQVKELNRHKSWNLENIIESSSNSFIRETNKDITKIIEKDKNNVDKIFFSIKQIFDQDAANKWLIYFLKELLDKVNHTGINQSQNLYNLYNLFDKIDLLFTTNYDPSFYWTIMKIKNKWPTRSSSQIKISPRGGKNPNFDDGFFLVENKLKFHEDSNCKVFYLHGAIFFKKEILEGIKIEKISSKNTNKDIIKNCNEYLESCLEIMDNNLPLLAVIGKNKNDDIQKNAYLKFALNKLINCDKIITFGLSFYEDRHLLDNIIKHCEKDYSKTKDLYVGCYNLETDKTTDNPRVNFEAYFKINPQPDNLNIIFYESQDIDNLNNLNKNFI